MAYKAFIVGVDTLGLKYSALDAQRLSTNLEKYGYETILPENNKYTLQAEFDALIDKAAQTDTICLYFSGHGLLEKGKLWFVLQDDASKPSNKLNINDWLETFSECRASNKVVILDCCNAGQGIADLRLELSDRYLVLAASARLEKCIEIDEIKASFFTHCFCQVLDNPTPKVLENEIIISIQKLHTWLMEEAQKYNGQNEIQVPVPKLFGSHSDFALAKLSSSEELSAVKANTEARLQHSVELRYRKLLLDNCDIVSLANLPEQDRHLAIRPLEIRRLYAPLRVWVDFKAGVKTKDAEWDDIEKRRSTVNGAHFGKDASSRERLRASVGERLTESRRLIVLGDPGAGKTTLTRWIATAFLLRLNKDVNWRDLPDVRTLPDADWLPIIVRCRDLDSNCLNGTLDDILKHTLRKAEIEACEAAFLHELLHTRLKEGTALLILDGLDEITDPGQRANFCQQLERIHLAHSNAPIIATSRIVGYREMGYRLERGFEHVTLADLEPAEKDDFARRWCDLTEMPGRRAEAARELIHDIHSSDRIERLTGNPMLLTTMALVKRKVGKLPSRRADLYGEAVQVLLNWRREVDEPLDPLEAIPQLEYVAYAMCDRGVQHLRRDEIINLITKMRLEYPNIHQTRNHTPDEFLNLLEARTGLLVESGRIRHLGIEETIYEFRHLTFQEYLAARALVAGHLPGRDGRPLATQIPPLAGRMAEASFTKNGEKEMAVVENWREALRLCVAICSDDDVDKILRAIVTRLDYEPEATTRARAILAALCLADEPNVSEELALEILEIFSGQISKVDNNYEIKSGVHVAASSIAETRWAMLLCQCLTNDFLARDSLVRDYWGDIAGLVYSKTAPSDPVALSTWWSKQAITLQDGNEFQAIQAALGIAAKAATGRPVQITPEIIESLLTRLTGSAPMSHAAAGALACLHGYNRGDIVWRPRSKDNEQFVEIISDSKSDPETVRYLSWILEREQVVASIDPLMIWSEHPKDGLKAQVAISLGVFCCKRTIETLIVLSKDTDAEVRCAAAEALGNMRDDKALEPLFALLEDSDSEVRGAAAMALGNMRKILAMEPLFVKLEDANAEVRNAVVWALSKLKSELMVEPLLARLEDSDSEVRNATVWALGNLKCESALEPLLARLEDVDSEVRDAVVWVLSEQKSDRLKDLLIARLECSDVNVRSAAVEILGNLKIELAVEPLIALLEDTDLKVRSAAAKALGELNSEHAVEPLIARLGDSEAIVRSAAAEALSELKNELAVEPLLACLDDSDANVRTAVAGALGELKSEKAIEPLITKLKDSEATVRSAVAGALGELKSNRAVEPLLLLLKDANNEVQVSVIRALSVLPGELAEMALLSQLENPDKKIQRAVVWELGNQNRENLVEPLLAMLENSDSMVRNAAIDSLSKLKSARSTEPLISLLGNSNAETRYAATRVLRMLKCENSVEILLALLKDSYSHVRSAAATTLGSLKSELAVDSLITLLDDPNMGVRRAAVMALSDIGNECSLELLLTQLEDSEVIVRSFAVEALSMKIEKDDRRLLTKDLDGEGPFLDPREIITVEWVNDAARILGCPNEIILAKYESLSAQFKLQLGWKHINTD